MRGNTPIPKAGASIVKNGKIITELLPIKYNGSLVPLFTIISPETCEICGAPLKKNKSYHRYVIHFSNVLKFRVYSHQCINPECRKSYSDQIIGVDRGKNYSNPFLEALNDTRYRGKCSLNNTRKVGEIFSLGEGGIGRAPSATTLWKYDQTEGIRALQALRETEINFDGKVYCDGIWIKTLTKKVLEKILGREISTSQWGSLRYKVVYVVATKEKVILDYEITNINPPYFVLSPLFHRLKERFGADSLKHLVTDEEAALFEAAKSVFPGIKVSFCVFHQLKHISDKFLEVYKHIDKIPKSDRVFMKLFNRIILSESVIEASAYFSKVEELVKGKGVSPVVMRVYRYVKGKYFSNRKLFEKNLMPETNNTMEQIFSTIKDFIIQCRSFKLISGLRNFMAILFHTKNSEAFVSGKHRGNSPLKLNGAPS